MAEAEQPEENSGENEGGDPSLYFILFSFLLVAIILLSKKLHESPRWNAYLSEAALVLILGSVAGAVIHLVLVPSTSNNEPENGAAAAAAADNTSLAALAALLSFDPHIFFYALLPPIIFCSGFNLRRELFYRHIKPIVLFACFGTAVSALATGGLLCLARVWFSSGVDDNDDGTGFAPTIMELFTFGALISATDAVSVLAIFQKKRVDPHLFSLVFGESALNDAVALVLFHVFAHFVVAMQYHDYAGVGSIVQRVLIFVLEFLLTAILSPMLGIGLGVVVALIFKHCDLRHHPKLELTIYCLLMYIPFLIAEECHLSGIVAIFFTGMSASRYVNPNVSATTQRHADAVFHLAAYVAETAIFLELGLSLSGLSTGSFHWIFIGCAFGASLLGRALSVYPLAYLYNVSLRELPAGTVGMDDSDGDGKQEELLDDNLDASNNTASPSRGEGEIKRTLPQLRTGSKRRRTPAKRKDRKISVHMSHIVWFAGLRGAVAYACAREFPIVHGHQDEMMTATMVIVLFTIIVMGGTTEMLLQALGIEVDVDEDLYMENWHKQRELRGPFHAFGKERDIVFSLFGVLCPFCLL
jgi:NhaP-type Na+/H+ or K+/H+ antiporter